MLIAQLLVLPDIVYIVESILSRVLDKTLTVSDSSESVITCCLHLLVHGLDAQPPPEYFEAINEKLLHVLLKLTRSSLAGDHKESIQWILNELEAQPVCKSILDQHKDAKPSAMATSTDRKAEMQRRARERAIASMAKQRASFMTMMENEESKEEVKEKKGCVCILCHEDTKPQELGYVGYFQETSVLAGPIAPTQRPQR